MNVKKSDSIYDVVVIGSGAAGGMAAWNLTRQGVNVLVLDAGSGLIARNTGRTLNRGRRTRGTNAANMHPIFI